MNHRQIKLVCNLPWQNNIFWNYNYYVVTSLKKAWSPRHVPSLSLLCSHRLRLISEKTFSTDPLRERIRFVFMCTVYSGVGIIYIDVDRCVTRTHTRGRNPLKPFGINKNDGIFKYTAGSCQSVHVNVMLYATYVAVSVFLPSNPFVGILRAQNRFLLIIQAIITYVITY